MTRLADLPVRILPPLALAFGAARPRATSLAYLMGSVGSLVAATAVFIRTPHLLSDVEWSTGGAAAWFRIGLGVLLILVAGFVWTKRGRTGRSVPWLSGLTRITPTVAAALAVSLTILNPKVMVATAAAGLVIGTAALGSAGTAAVLAAVGAAVVTTGLIAVFP